MRLARLPEFEHLHLAECPSTQTFALDFVREGSKTGLISTDHQTSGRGRFDRKWTTAPFDSLTFSVLQWPYAEFSNIPMLGMAWAIAVAEAVDGQLQWPNDVVIEGKKVAGILTEIVIDPAGRRVPVVGIGVNITQTIFPPEIEHRATSLALSGRPTLPPQALLEEILRRVESIPDPTEWAVLQSQWMRRDATPGKMLKLPSGSVVIATGIDENGQLLAEENGRLIATPVAEVLY